MAETWLDIGGRPCSESTDTPYDLWAKQSTYISYLCDSDGSSGRPPSGVGPIWYSELTSYWDIPSSGSYPYNYLIRWVGPDYPTATKMRIRYHNPAGLDGSEWAVLCRMADFSSIDTVPLAAQLVGVPIDGSTTEFLLDLPAGEGLLGPGSAPDGLTLAPIVGPNPQGGMFAIAVNVGGATDVWTDFIGCRQQN